MKLLILGGTIFLGRHLVDAALARGHEVTLFNRGQHNPHLYPQVEKLRGDRNGDLRALEGRRWDACIDTCGYLPPHVRASAQLLAKAVDHYTYISSLSVYPDYSSPGIDERAPVQRLTAQQMLELSKVKTLTPATVEKYQALYGPLKALCEQAALMVMPGRVLNIRAGVLVGPYEQYDRFAYWVHRIAHGGEVLAPGRPDRPVQIIDARDLAQWTIRMIEARRTGTYNATGPDYELTIQQLLEECIVASGSDAHLVWVANEFLIEEGVVPLKEMTMWHPDEARIAGLSSVNCDKAIAAGLTFRPLSETIQDTLAWDAWRPADLEWRAGLLPAREAQLLRAWHAQTQGHKLQ